MISRFFIDRPIFANVIAVVTVLFGVVALYKLPVERYPAITPPTIVVSTNFPGARSQDVADAVATTIEQEVNGVENMMYMSSTSSADGSYSLTITFEIGTDLDNAQVLVQNRLRAAEPRLPAEVRQQGVQVKKQSSNIVLAITLNSPPPKDQYDVVLDPVALADLKLSPAAVLGALAQAGAKAEPQPEDGPDAYRLTVPDDFTTDGPAGADKLRGVEIPPASGGRAGVRVADVARVKNLKSPFDPLFLSNYATLRLRDDLSRVKGVGEVMVRGVGAYSMRVWLDPDKLAARQLTTKDVTDALARQNVQVPAGQTGQPPNPSGQAFQMTITTRGRLKEAKEFEDIVLKSGTGGGQTVYLRDVARVELGGQTYDSYNSRSGYDSATILIFQLPGSNALEVAKGVRETMQRIEPSLPPGMIYNIPFDTTKFVDAAITSVYETLAEAGLLVLIVILIFLQSWRALLVPATTVPVTIIGAFAFMPFLGFSVNLLTLFGLVLAIGIVVDDAIVIVENASHHIEKGMAPREATIQAMNEVTGPVISITLVLMAVFVPTAFLPGITGELYRQFALTIAATAVISAINALTLKPAQCAAYLRPHAGRNVFTRLFDAVYKPVERGYSWCVRQLLRAWPAVLLAFVGIGVFTFWLYNRTPTGFLPNEDQGYVLIAVQLPDSASLDRTHEVTERMNKVFRKYRDQGAVENWFVLGGLSLLDNTNAPNGATAFAAWTDWSKRTSPQQQQDELVKAMQMEFFGMRDAFIIVIVPPAIQGLGFAGGFQMQIESKEGGGLGALQERATAIMNAARQRPEFDPMKFQSTFRAGVPQIYLNIDREKAEAMGVKMDDVFRTLQANLGSVYVNDFNKFDRTYQVRVQADARFRADPSVIRRLEVPGRPEAPGGPPKRVPLGTLITVEPSTGPLSVIRYNLYPSAAINGVAAQGVSSGDALKAMEEVATANLPPNMGYEWTSIAYQEKRVSAGAVSLFGLTLNQSLLVFGLSVLMVYFVLSALYESWLLPFAVILVVPLGLLGVIGAVNVKSLLGLWIPGVPKMDNNIYVQIGVVLIIALASKNAILIVEFARELRLAGRSVREAAIEASRMRFRPIIMTSFAFILGVTPLVFATGAGAASRQSLGTAVFGGMITSTVLAVFFVPAFYVAIQYLIELRNGPPKPHVGADTPVAAHDVPPPAAEPTVKALPEANGANGSNGDAKRRSGEHPAAGS